VAVVEVFAGVWIAVEQHEGGDDISCAAEQRVAAVEQLAGKGDHAADICGNMGLLHINLWVNFLL
jgi:hypothetical protein